LYSTDHGELQGDYGLMFKGPYHVDSLMRVPLIWRPAPSAGVAAATVDSPVGHVSLASTFCHIAGLPRPAYTEADRLPIDDDEARILGHERVLTEWDSVLFGKILHLRTICRDGWVATTSTTSPTTPCSASTSGTIPPIAPRETISSPTCGIICPIPSHDEESTHPSDPQ
jgi:arylsulfatase A-like enzyme